MNILTDRLRLLALTDRVLSEPPRRSYTVRPKFSGSRVARFVLPLELCPTSNQGVRHVEAWKLAKHRAETSKAMVLQCSHFSEPLPGRPLVCAVRFSRRAPDKYSDFAKVAIDLLTPRRTEQRRSKRGLQLIHRGCLGIIREDNPSRCEQWQWSEPIPSGEPEGWVVLDVWTGEAT